VSAHFALAEFLASDTARSCGIDNFPTWDEVGNLARLADTMELVRDMLGACPVLITSGYRCEALNAEVGGVPDSAHRYGLACDFHAPDFGSVQQICWLLEPYVADLALDQLILEMGWVHLGLSLGPARHQCLTIDDHGTRTGFG
jgi:hypothetical protein